MPSRGNLLYSLRAVGDGERGEGNGETFILESAPGDGVFSFPRIHHGERRWVGSVGVGGGMFDSLNVPKPSLTLNFFGQFARGKVLETFLWIAACVFFVKDCMMRFTLDLNRTHFFLFTLFAGHLMPEWASTFIHGGTDIV